MAEQLETFMTPAEVADLLRVSIYTVRRWIKDEAIPAYKVGRAWRINSVDFEDWLEEKKTVPGG